MNQFRLRNEHFDHGLFTTSTPYLLYLILSGRLSKLSLNSEVKHAFMPQMRILGLNKSNEINRMKGTNLDITLFLPPSNHGGLIRLPP